MMHQVVVNVRNQPPLLLVKTIPNPAAHTFGSGTLGFSFSVVYEYIVSSIDNTYLTCLIQGLEQFSLRGVQLIQHPSLRNGLSNIKQMVLLVPMNIRHDSVLGYFSKLLQLLDYYYKSGKI
jgi:hypothetical protein